MATKDPSTKTLTAHHQSENEDPFVRPPYQLKCYAKQMTCHSKPVNPRSWMLRQANDMPLEACEAKKLVRDEMDSWAHLQARLISQFTNASSIIRRLQVLQDSNNYGGLNVLVHIQEAVLVKQMESLQKILLSMKNTMEEVHGIVLSLGRIHRDGKQMIKGGSSQLSIKQLQQRVGVRPSLADFVDGLMLLHDMHCSEYLLKASLVSALSELTLKPSDSDLGSLQQILINQPNIPKEEVQFIFDIIFAEEIF